MIDNRIKSIIDVSLCGKRCDYCNSEFVKDAIVSYSAGFSEKLKPVFSNTTKPIGFRVGTIVSEKKLNKMSLKYSSYLYRSKIAPSLARVFQDTIVIELQCKCGNVRIIEIDG